MLTRDQQRATLILEQVKAVPPEQRKAYGGMAQELPVLIRTAGLCQALEFVHTRDKPPLNELLKDLAQAVGLKSADELLEHSRTQKLEQYMWLTQEVLAALLWYKRFAQSILDVKPGERGVER